METEAILTEDHATELLGGSAIIEKVLDQRGYQSILDPADLPEAFADYQRRPGLLIPIRSVRGEIESYQIKPNQPRIGKNGKPIKYETAANARQIIDVPTAALPHLGNPKINLLITEGAKKVDSAVSHGILCTIGLQGVYGWRGKNEHGGSTALADWEQIALKNRTVVIAFDSDVMTKAEVRGALDRFSGFLNSRGAKVKYILMPNLPNGDKCGLDDWFANSTESGNVAKLDALAALAVDTLPQIGPSVEVLSSAARNADQATIRPNAQRMSEVEAKEIDWLWPGWIPRGMLSLLGGYAGDGKSTLTTSLIASLSTGSPLPDGSIAPITNSLILPAEDDVAHVVKPRLALHGADMERVHVMQTVFDADGTARGLNLRTDIAAIAQLVQEQDIGLIVIDPMSGFTPRADRNNEGEVRDNLQQLIPLMEQYRCAVLGVMHIGKNAGHARAYQSLMGSTAYTAVARSVVMVSNLPMAWQVEGEPMRKVVGVAKSNYAEAPEPIQFCRPRDEALRFLGPSPVGLDAALNAKAGDGEEKTPTEAAKAEEWLLDFMEGKRMLASVIETAAKDAGFSKPTLSRARKSLGIESRRRGDGWEWHPPISDAA